MNFTRKTDEDHFMAHDYEMLPSCIHWHRLLQHLCWFRDRFHRNHCRCQLWLSWTLMSCRLLLASNSKHRTAFCAALFCKITDGVTRPLRSHFVMLNTITCEVTMWPLTYDGCDDLRSPRESTRDLRRNGGFFSYLERNGSIPILYFLKCLCSSLFFPDQRNGPS